MPHHFQGSRLTLDPKRCLKHTPVNGHRLFLSYVQTGIDRHPSKSVGVRLLCVCVVGVIHMPEAQPSEGDKGGAAVRCRG